MGIDREKRADRIFYLIRVRDRVSRDIATAYGAIDC
jgi:hypothetical protein